MCPQREEPSTALQLLRKACYEARDVYDPIRWRAQDVKFDRTQAAQLDWKAGKITRTDLDAIETAAQAQYEATVKDVRARFYEVRDQYLEACKLARQGETDASAH